MGVVGPWSWLLGAVGGHELACRHAVGGRSDAVDREVRLTISTGSRSLHMKRKITNDAVLYRIIKGIIN